MIIFTCFLVLVLVQVGKRRVLFSKVIRPAAFFWFSLTYYDIARLMRHLVFQSLYLRKRPCCSSQRRENNARLDSGRVDVVMNNKKLLFSPIKRETRLSLTSVNRPNVSSVYPCDQFVSSRFVSAHRQEEKLDESQTPIEQCQSTQELWITR